ncbi:MAG: tyrosine-type recombinase/integrase [Lachnospiraceae bacterium]|nr:tyrosine-type recombinase/integrase [Lachnospiraceae bacterium]
MKKLKMKATQGLTFEEGCNKYLEYCRQRNLRQGTINHYRQSYVQFFKFFEPDTPIEEIDEDAYKRYVLYLRSTLNNDVSINSYLRDFITTMHYLMNEGYIQSYKMRAIKVDKSHIETYNEQELQLLLKKPNIKKCSFIEYQAWVMTNFLFSTAVRQRSLMFIKVKDIDFDNNVVYVNVTKNRKPLIVPLNQTMVNILREYLKYRNHKTDDDYLFCNVFGQQLVKSTCYHMLYEYNKRRGVETTGIHRYRHTFAKQWILSGGNVVSLSQLLGHSSLEITQNYIHLLVSDVAKQVDEINVLDKFYSRTHISLKK